LLDDLGLVASPVLTEGLQTYKTYYFSLFWQSEASPAFLASFVASDCLCNGNGGE
jgi:hypothetical protein